jgi:nicotinamidase/pyrazinamidase
MKALLLIDLQNDFMPGGSLGVPDGQECVESANRAQHFFNFVIASKDWHPPHHLSFASEHKNKKVGDIIMLNGLPQTLWPVHCVQHTHGAALVKNLNQSKIRHIITKGTDPAVDSYSAFFDNAHRHETGLASYLKLSAIEEIFLLGVATEYCVKYTALDSLKLGFKTNVIIDGCRGIGLNSEDIPQALEDMRKEGANLLTIADLQRR